MAKFKKAATLLTALLLCGSMFASVACNNEKNTDDSSLLSSSESLSSEESSEESSSEESLEESSSEESSEYIPPEPTIFELEEHTWTAWETVTPKTCSADGEEKLVCTDEGCGAVKTRTVKASHAWGDWTGSTEKLCTEDATITRTCADCQETETQTVAMRGHAYEGAYCKVCDEPFVFPTLNNSPTYVDVWGNSVRGDGTAFNRKALATDTYYTIDVPATDPESEDGGVWISVPVSEAGQYALLTVGSVNGVTIERFDATDFYIPGDENGYLGESALQHANGASYSIVNCSNQHFNEQWRATWRFSAETAATVKFVVVKVASPIWAPESIHEKVYPTQINNVKAADAPTGYTALTVDYNDSYYYDEWNGVYRRGSKENPGEVIYLAIDTSATRLFGEQSFITIQEENDNLTLPHGKDELGNYLLREYHAFMLSEAAQYGNAYQNYVNSDGMYPVTQELHEFLQLYTQKNRPIDIPESIVADETEYAQKAWLAPCYYYRELKPGTAEYPYSITELGDFEANIPKLDQVYFTIKYSDESGEPVSTLVLSCDDTNARARINEKIYKGPFSVTIEVDASQGITFFIGAADKTATTITLNLSLAEANA